MAPFFACSSFGFAVYPGESTQAPCSGLCRLGTQVHRPTNGSLELSTRAKASLQSHRQQLEDRMSRLCPEGKVVFSALEKAMSQAASEECVHFESALREHLERRHAGFQSLERVASGQWRCFLFGKEFLVSLRTEVLGDGEQASDYLARLKQEARIVRSTLLENNAQWMKSLGSSMNNKAGFLKQCQEARHQRFQRQSNPLHRDDEYTCAWCRCPKSSSHLAGRHHCSLVAVKDPFGGLDLLSYLNPPK